MVLLENQTSSPRHQGVTQIKINQCIETPDGKVNFQGELSKEEVDFCIEFAINNLVARGVVPFHLTDDLASIGPNTGEVQ